MKQCYTPCIFYHEVYDKTKKPSVRVICDIKDGKEIKDIPDEEIQNCEHFKTYNEIKENNKNFVKLTLDRLQL